MNVSPFTFYRGAAKIMATDLKDTPTAGLEVQLCGDAHLSNFGVFASPERALLFDLNDFDETLPGPFEYDVKRMAASFTIAGRNNGSSTADTRAATMASVTPYRDAMAGFAQMGNLDIWYAHLSEQEIMKGIRALATGAGSKKEAAQVRKGEKAARKTAEKAHTRDSLRRQLPVVRSSSTGRRVHRRRPHGVPTHGQLHHRGTKPGGLQPPIRRRRLLASHPGGSAAHVPKDHPVPEPIRS